MALFTYKAIDATGKSRIGQTEAINVVDLELRLKRMGLDLIVGSPAKRAFGGLGGRITRADLINFCFHLEQMTQSGVLLTDGLADLRDSVENPRLREVISGSLESIQGGMSLSQALAQYPHVFDAVFRALVKAGEDTGRLPDVLKSLAEKLRWEDELAAQTKRVVLYPAIITVIMIGVVLFLMIYLVPQMVGFIKNMGQEIPIYTKVLIAVSNFLVAYWYLVISLPIMGGATLAYLIRNNPRVRYRVDGLILRIPLLGTTLRKIILARFASVFALMYASGITIIDAMKSAEEAAGNKVMEEGLRQAGQQIAEGKTVTAAFQDVGIFPPLVVRMLRVGENTGRLDTALLNVNYFYTREVRENVARMQVLIEPALILVLGGVLFWVIVSVLGPIYDVFTKLKI